MAHAGRSQVGRGNRAQFVLVGAQVALAVTLLAGAALLLRSLQELGRVSPGFDPGRVLAFHISMSWGETGDPSAARQRTRRILEALRSVPGVENAATAMSLPGVPSEYRVQVKPLEGRAESEPKMLVQGRVVSSGYFATVGIPLLAGEWCRDDASSTMMVNRSFANMYMPGNSALGRHLGQPGNQYIPNSEIQGIVGNARETGVDQAPSPTVYWCIAAAQPGLFFLVRTHGVPASMAETLRRRLQQVEPRRSVYDLAPLTENISGAYAENRLRTVLLTFFAVTAMLLACVGLYGTLTYLVNVRQREVGLRLALGALRGQIVRHFLAQGLYVALTGCAAGLALAGASARLLAGLLFGVSPSDVPTLAAVIGVVIAVSIIASLLPAIRAARLEPMQVLRDE
jgi:putative ABC transport system permease protein